MSSLETRAIVKKELPKLISEGNKFFYKNPYEAIIEFEKYLEVYQFCALVNQAKRRERESGGEKYLFSDFRDELIKFKAYRRVVVLCDKFNISAIVTFTNDHDFRNDHFIHSRVHPTGTITKRVFDVKHNFRVMFKRDLET